MQEVDGMNVKTSFATRLKALRERQGLNQGQLAMKLGISRGSISFYENGDRIPDIETFDAICNFFGVSYDYLLGKSDLEENNIEVKAIREYTQLTERNIELLHWYNKDYLIDVLNDIIVDARITKSKTSERLIAKQYIETIDNIFSPQKSIIIFDRGYPSYDMFDYLNSKELLFLMRVSTSFKLAQSVKSPDSILKYKVKGEIKKIRVIKVKLSDEVTETLVTNIYDDTITPVKFKELYFLRWGVESKYKELKNSLKIEEFSGTKPIAIEQDFYASIYLSMVGALLKKDADIAIANDNKNKGLKAKYQSNRNFILGQVFKNIIHIITKNRHRKKILMYILEKAIKIRSQIRCNRSCERKNKHPRKKHHHNVKSCI